MSDYDWFDTLPGDAQENIRAHEAIARELAAHDSYVAYGYDDVGYCPLCLASGVGGADLDDHANHEPECLWRRAKALYPGAGEP